VDGAQRRRLDGALARFPLLISVSGGTTMGSEGTPWRRSWCPPRRRSSSDEGATPVDPERRPRSTPIGSLTRA
jgi:hypothetical protein